MSTRKYESSAIPNQSFLQPFNVFFWRYDFHVMLYFEGHPEYEAVEAMIKEGEGKEPLVWVIMTRHNQTQIDFVNDKAVAERTQVGSSRKEVYHTDIFYHKTVEGGKPHISLGFVSSKGEDVFFDFYATGRPLKRHRGLIDPGTHGEASVLPVMYRESSTLASPRSSLVIGGKNYVIPVKVSIPFFFKGMKGYYSEMFSLGGIGSGELTCRLIRAPEKIAVGQEWLYEVNGSILSYVVKERSIDHSMVQKLPDASQTIDTLIVDGHLEIAEIRLTSRAGDTGYFALGFSPSLPDILSMPEGHKFLSTFALSIDEQRALVTGNLEIEKGRGIVLLTLRPTQPTWAKQRAMNITVSGEGSSYRIQSVLGDTR